MITSETSHTLAMIIRDTWPQLFWLKDSKEVNKNGRINTFTTKEDMV